MYLSMVNDCLCVLVPWYMVIGYSVLTIGSVVVLLLNSYGLL